MIKSVITILISSLISVAVMAQESEESELLMSLQQEMQHFSELATETKQNVDYMPYVISTLNNKDLKELGVINLREAVSLIPGVDLNVGMAGVKNPIFRGSNPYAFGQSRLIIDGMVVNDQIFGGYNQFLEMPIDIIHRIEVVRGPGSMLNHVNGYAGSIHVITKANRDDEVDQQDEAFLLSGSNSFAGAGVIKSFKIGEGYFSSDIYYQQHDLELPVGDDRIPFPPASGISDQSLENYQIGLNYKNSGLYIKSRFSQNDSGVSYGQAFSISEDNTDFLDVGNNSVEIKYIKTLTESVSLELVLDYIDETRELKNKVMPDGAIVPPGITLVDGRYFLVDYTEQTFSERVQLNFNLTPTHKLHIGVNFKQSEIGDNNAATSDDDLASLNEFDLFSNRKRNVKTYYIEDMFDVSSSTTIQLGGKLSQYNDVEDQSAFRVAAVHRYDDENIFKVMFSQAFREPSWREQYLTAPAFFLPNPVLEVEEVDALELAYIRHISHRDYFKLNAFYLKNDNQIDAQNSTRTFSNTAENDLYGFELEYGAEIFDRDIFSFNYSYIDGSNVSGEMVNSAQVLVNTYYLYRFSEKINYSALLKYAGDKSRVTADTRADVDAYALMDLSVSYQDSPGALKFGFTLKNVFDKTYYLPSPDNTYPDDFEQPERTWLLRLSKEF